MVGLRRVATISDYLLCTAPYIDRNQHRRAIAAEGVRKSIDVTEIGKEPRLTMLGWGLLLGAVRPNERTQLVRKTAARCTRVASKVDYRTISGTDRGARQRGLIKGTCGAAVTGRRPSRRGSSAISIWRLKGVNPERM
jgi:hypothetical protein